MKGLFAAFLLAHHATSATVCGDPLDIMFLQDTTGSFDDDLAQITTQLSGFVNSVEEMYKNSRFGVAEFRDKPFYPLGEADDFCYKLGDGALTSNKTDFKWAYEGLYASGGADTPEASFQALINVALDPAVGWSNRTRVVVLNTDAVTHLPGDMNAYSSDVYPEVPHNLPPNSGTIPDNDTDYTCLFEDYPSPTQMRDALQSQNIILVITTPDDDADMTASWTWVNEELLGQPSHRYIHIQKDSSDLAEKLLDLLYSVAPACPTEPPTTTPAITEVTSGQNGTCVCPTPCPPPCTNPCCAQNEVMVVLKHRPAHLHMEIHN